VNRIIRGAVLAASLLVAASGARGAEVAELLAGDTRELGPAAASSAELRYPMSLPSGLSAVPVLVMNGAREEPAVLDRLSAKLEDGARGAALHLALVPGEPLRPGPHEVSVRLFDPAGKASPQVIRVKVLVPFAQLAGPPKLEVAVVIPMFGGPEVTPPVLHLRETSFASPVSIRKVEADGMALNDGRWFDPGLTFTTLPALPPGGVADIPASLSGAGASLPLGTTTGAIAIHAPEIANQRLDVPYEIRVRYTLWIVFWVAMIGFMMGLVIRRLFERVLKVGEARDKAREMLDQLTEMQKAYADADFQHRTRAAGHAMSVITKARWDEKVIADAVTTAQGVLDAALKDVVERLSSARRSFDALSALVAEPDPLPADAGVALSEAPASLASIKERLEAGDAGGAQSGIDQLVQQLLRKLISSGRAWKAELLGTLDALPPLDGLVTDSGMEATKVRDAVNECAIDRALEPADRTLEGLRAKLSSWSAVHQQVVDFERLLKQKAGEAIDAILDLSPAGPDGSTALGGAKQKLALEDLRSIRQWLPDLLARSIIALGASRGASDEALEEMVKRGQYLRAITALREPVPVAATRAAHDVLVFSTSHKRVEGVQQISRRAGDNDHQGAAAGSSFYGSRRFFNTIRVLNSALIGLLVACTAVSVHARSFVGTPADLLAVFVWTAGVNTVTADLLGMLASKLAPQKLG